MDSRLTQRVAVLVPSRDRPEKLADLCRSILSTSTNADVFVYVDEDQRDSYEAVMVREHFGGRVAARYGEQAGPICSVNTLFSENPDYAAYIVLTDDCIVTGSGWDKWLLDDMGAKANVWAASPAHSLGSHVDFAAVSGDWARALGWVCYPGCYHWCWPSAIEVLGCATLLAFIPREVMFIEHEHLAPMNQEYSREDARQFYAFVSSGRFMVAVGTLQGATR